VNDSIRTSRAAFVIIKLVVSNDVYLLLRKNVKWNDLNFVGGHQKERDQGSLVRTAQRELWEEVPSIRGIVNTHLVPVTDEVLYGPVYSRSVGRETIYRVQFFRLAFEQQPTSLIQKLSTRSRNVLVPEQRLFLQNSIRISGLIKFLHERLAGGIASIPVSSPTNLHPPAWWSGQVDQLELRAV
jgi:hypothetical protein